MLCCDVKNRKTPPRSSPFARHGVFDAVGIVVVLGGCGDEKPVIHKTLKQLDIVRKAGSLYLSNEGQRHRKYRDGGKDKDSDDGDKSSRKGNDRTEMRIRKRAWG